MIYYFEGAGGIEDIEFNIHSQKSIYHLRNGTNLESE